MRLYKGDMAEATVYSSNPAAQAVQFQDDGFEYLHIVDLNGAVDGIPVNERVVKEILNAVDIPVQLGGGIRSMTHIEFWLEAGVERVILGTAAVKDPDLVEQACRRYPGRIAVGIDARGENVAVEGWVEESEVNIFDLAKRFEEAGVAVLIYTDIERDGTGEGLNIETTRKLARFTEIPVIASGGVGSLTDIQNMTAMELDGVQGVIIGKALYDGRLRAEEILNA